MLVSSSSSASTIPSATPRDDAPPYNPIAWDQDCFYISALERQAKVRLHRAHTKRPTIVDTVKATQQSVIYTYSKHGLEQLGTGVQLLVRKIAEKCFPSWLKPAPTPKLTALLQELDSAAVERKMNIYLQQGDSESASECAKELARRKHSVSQSLHLGGDSASATAAATVDLTQKGGIGSFAKGGRKEDGTAAASSRYQHPSLSMARKSQMAYQQEQQQPPQPLRQDSSNVGFGGGRGGGFGGFGAAAGGDSARNQQRQQRGFWE